jgi:hypothetical protein
MHKNKMGWICSRCETYHDGGEVACEVCGGSNPVVIAVTAPKTPATDRPKAPVTALPEVSTTILYTSPSVSARTSSKSRQPNLSGLYLCLCGLVILGFVAAKTVHDTKEMMNTVNNIKEMLKNRHRIGPQRLQPLRRLDDIEPVRFFPERP